MKQPILYDPAPSILEIIVKIAKKIWRVKKKYNHYCPVKVD